MIDRPLALSLGDPAGIGPEIVLKAWRALSLEGPAFFVIGDADALAAADGAAPLAVIDAPDEAAGRFPGALPVLHRPLSRPALPGQPSADHAAAILDWIETGVRLCLEGQAAGLVTAPIAKAPLYAAGFGFPGHTEFLGELTSAAPMAGPRGPVMMLAAEGLRVALATVHTPLSAVSASLDTNELVRLGEVVAAALRADFGIAAPRLAVAGLNPHAGESGGIGREEIDIIAPAVEALRARGVDAFGPSPADTLFHAEARARHDAVLCMYHDQALIPLKMLDFWGGVNITLGLPIVRTSPDHGTGFDIAGRGIARADSLIAAIRMARAVADRRAAA
ncbi:MAG: 4-hydroxythreonine-4-phosphate dehydrogenase PdxA [Caulobacter sp.]